MGEWRELSRLRDDLALAAGLVPLDLQDIDLGCSAALIDRRAWVILAGTCASSDFELVTGRLNVYRNRVTHDARWPGSHESSKLYFEREASE